jgi:hypothetical protein
MAMAMMIQQPTRNEEVKPTILWRYIEIYRNTGGEGG